MAVFLRWLYGGIDNFAIFMKVEPEVVLAFWALCESPGRGRLRRLPSGFPATWDACGRSAPDPRRLRPSRWRVRLQPAVRTRLVRSCARRAADPCRHPRPV